MQDGARPHRTDDVFELLFEHFGHRVIALDYPKFSGGGLDWPPYSPDLNPCDYFLWGYLKDSIYKETPKTIDDLKTAISDQIHAIGRDTCEAVITGFEKRLRHVVVSDGAHFENIIY